MIFKDYMVILLLGHVIGDFYLQTDLLSRRKERNLSWVLIHCALYAFGMFLACIPALSITMLVAFLAASLFHMAVDTVKFALVRTFIPKRGLTPDIRRIIFICDQLVHLITIAIVALIFSMNNFSVRLLAPFEKIFTTVGVPGITVAAWTLALLLIHKPANLLIQMIIGGFKPTVKDNASEDKNTGRVIGTIERIIMLILIAIQQYSAIGLVLTAKSVARFERITKERDFAEYYLMGTLVSTAIVVIVSFLI